MKSKVTGRVTGKVMGRVMGKVKGKVKGKVMGRVMGKVMGMVGFEYSLGDDTFENRPWCRWPLDQLHGFVVRKNAAPIDIAKMETMETTPYEERDPRAAQRLDPNYS